MGRCWFPLVAYARVMGRCFHFSCSGLWDVFYFVACEFCAQYVGFWLFLVYQVLSASSSCPSSYVLGEVLYVFLFFWWPFGFVYYSFLLGFALFGNKFLIIQKKKRHAFITWLVVQDRLFTQDKLLNRAS